MCHVPHLRVSQASRPLEPYQCSESCPKPYPQAQDLAAVREQIEVFNMEKAFKAAGGARKRDVGAPNTPGTGSRPSTAQSGAGAR